MSQLSDDIEYAERGHGPALLLLPGSFGTGSGWRPLIERLGEGYRFVTTSLLGYGGTAERRRPDNATMAQQTEALDALFERIGAPVHVVAHSFGGAGAVAHALSGRHRAASLTLIEANPFGMLRTAGEDALYAAFGAMTSVYFADFEAGRSDAARHVVDFYGGEGTFDAFPQKVRDYIIATTPTNILDWASATSFEPTQAECGRITAPTLIVRGGNGHPAMLRLAELLAASVRQASLVTMDGGSHFLPATHPDELARLIVAHVQTVLSRGEGNPQD